ncbi:LysR family transcriptional regulator [Aliamphritea hakodatensis]|uniref:LysR family transcriptional regulator n=1 Tax=Aliamphritea hakodatensis TaxID=2895352 RepID=UPI0022FD8E7A|nr:LysR family transcriptional regulator [Aliamphritea hakodatensis]
MSIENIRQLRALAIFALVVESGSFAAAAKKLATSRSRTSETVASLEKELGIRLLNRSTRKLTLTSEGRSVYHHASQLQQVLDSVEADTNQHTMAGRISITCTHDIGVKKLADHLAAFEQLYPDISVELQLSDEPVDLIAGEIDLAIRVGIPKDSSLVGRSLFQEPMGIYASPSFLERHGMPESPESLSAHRWVLLTQYSGRKTVELECGDQRLKVTPEFVHLCNAPLMMQKMISCGMGLGILLPSTVTAEIQKGELVPVLPGWHGGVLTFSLMYPSRKHLPLRTRSLVDYLIEHFER